MYVWMCVCVYIHFTISYLHCLQYIVSMVGYYIFVSGLSMCFFKMGVHLCSAKFSRTVNIDLVIYFRLVEFDPFVCTFKF